MILCTVQFDPGKSRTYKRLLDVFLFSVKKHIPGIEIKLINIPAPNKELSMPRNFTYNTRKLDVWNNFLVSTDQDVIFADCDMLCARDPLPSIERLDFDIAYTETGLRTPPMNGGMIFVRNNQRSRDFMKLWLDVNNKMYYQDRNLHQVWKNKYLGMNQAAFGYLINKCKFEAKVTALPTLKYNATDQDWKNINDNTCFIHIKSELRREILNNTEPSGNLSTAMTLWYQTHSELPEKQKAPESLKPKSKPKGTGYRKLRRRGRIVWR